MKYLYSIIFLVALTAICQASDIWFIDGRHSDFSSVAKLEDGGQWTDSSLDEFLKTHQSDKPLLIFVHGNEMSYPESKYYGKIAAGLVENTKDIEKHRLVIWSWAAEKVLRGIKKDALLKVRRADAQGPVLASFLQKLKPDSKVSLGGFSLGANVVCGALQALPEHSLRLRAVLLAAAIDRGSLSATGKYRDAVSKTEKFLIYVNPDDWVLQFYPLLKGCNGPQAVGRTGASLYGHSEEVRKKVKSVNIQSRLGTEHAFVKSLRAFSADKDGFKCYAMFEE